MAWTWSGQWRQGWPRLAEVTKQWWMPSRCSQAATFPTQLPENLRWPNNLRSIWARHLTLSMSQSRYFCRWMVVSIQSLGFLRRKWRMLEHHLPSERLAEHQSQDWSFATIHTRCLLRLDKNMGHVRRDPRPQECEATGAEDREATKN